MLLFSINNIILLCLYVHAGKSSAIAQVWHYRFNRPKIPVFFPLLPNANHYTWNHTKPTFLKQINLNLFE